LADNAAAPAVGVVDFRVDALARAPGEAAGTGALRCVAVGAPSAQHAASPAVAVAEGEVDARAGAFGEPSSADAIGIRAVAIRGARVVAPAAVKRIAAHVDTGAGACRQGSGAAAAAAVRTGSPSLAARGAVATMGRIGRQIDALIAALDETSGAGAVSC